jgi:hypothetical protein
MWKSHVRRRWRSITTRRAVVAGGGCNISIPHVSHGQYCDLSLFFDRKPWSPASIMLNVERDKPALIRF